MGRRLTGRYLLTNPNTYNVESFGPETEDVPQWAADLITEESAWADEPSVQVIASYDEVTPPPKSGPGSSARAWYAYASAIGLKVDRSDTRDEIIEDLRDAGFRTE